MDAQFKHQCAFLFALSTFSFLATANTSFQGDTNQLSSSDPEPSYSEDIIVGNNVAGGSPQTPSGTMTIDGGSHVTGNQSMIIGNLTDSSGSATITGTGTTLNLIRVLTVGNGTGSYGELNILDGGTVNTLALRVGNGAGSDGIINVNGGSLNVTGSRYTGSGIIGNAGTGRLNITNGGTVSDNFTIIGGAGGNGAVAVSGNGSVFNSNLNTIVGNGGQGLVEVTDGGIFNASVGTSPASALVLGAIAVAPGIANGASVRIQGAGSTVNAMGGNTVIGENDTATILLEDGGRLNTTDIIIASQAGITGQLFIGFNGSGAGSVNDYATITFGNGQGSLNFNHNEQINFNNLIQGNGTVVVDSGITTLTAGNTWSGSTLINSGTLKAGTANTFSPNSTYTLVSNGIMELDGHNQTLSDVHNAGTINLSGQTAGTVMTVAGNYTGNNGLLIFGTELGDDDSATDRLLITGDTTGTSRVTVNNLGGSGAKTLNGIEVISVGGNSAGEFAQEGRIVAGAWEYHLARGEGINNANWYLSNREEDNGGGDNGGGDNSGGDNSGGDNSGGDNSGGDNSGGDNGGGDNGGGDNSGDDNGGGDNGGGDNGGGDNGISGGGDNGISGGGDSGNKIEILRPEGGAYAANLYAADTMFLAPLSNRMGETEYTDTMTGERKLTSLWMTNTGGHTRVNDTSGQLKTRSNLYSLILGGDLATGNSRYGSTWRTGALAGYGNSSGTTRSNITGYSSKGEVNGYTAGLYATWYGEGNSERGVYVDGVLQYSWFRNSVQGEDLPGEKYDSKGLSATVETGYVFTMGKVANRDDLSWYVQPKASLGWSGIKADDHREANGTLVQGRGNDNVNTRLGLKIYLKGYSSLDNGKERNFKPFMETTWIHNTENCAVTMNGSVITQAGTSNIGEVRMGVEGRLAPQLNVTVYAAQQIGDKDYSDTSGVLGIKYSF